jgi:hypothetical protein
MPAGRPRKPTEQLKLSGTYRADRHGNNADACIADTLAVPVEVEPPDSIIDSYCREHYKYHINLLIRLKILTLSDIPEIELLYQTLQQLRRIRERLNAMDIDTPGYIALSELLLKLSNYFSKVAQKYYISPTSRTRIQLEQLNLDQAKKKESSVSKLIKRKRA